MWEGQGIRTLRFKPFVCALSPVAAASSYPFSGETRCVLVLEVMGGQGERTIPFVF